MRALLLGGGTALGAVQVPVLHHLLARHQYDLIAGVSVGSLNGVLAAQGDLNALDDLWASIRHWNWFMRPCLPTPWMSGVFSLAPLARQIDKYVHLGTGDTPFKAGVVSLQGQAFHGVSLNTLPHSKQVEVLLASCAQPVIMSPYECTIYPESHHLPASRALCVDGGTMHVIPRIRWRRFTHIDAVACSPVERRDVVERHRVDGILEIAGRALETYMDATVQNDYAWLQRIAKTRRTKVTVYAPSPRWDIGSPFDASPETIQARLEIGAKMATAPVFASR